jgi:signal transduction histidine kinase/CheY-like chemotaxis protein
MPEEARQYRAVTPAPTGWSAATTDGLVLPAGTNWVLHRPPGGGDVLMAVPVDAGWVVAGRGFCRLYTPVGWGPLLSNDQFTTGAALRGEALLAGPSGIYHVDRSGALSLLRTVPFGASVKVLAIGDALMVFGGAGGIWRWTNETLLPAGPEFSWTKACDVVDVEPGAAGLTFATSRGVFSVGRGEPTPLLASRWKDWFREGLISAVQIDGELVVATFFGGVAGYSPATGDEHWHLRPESFRGEAYCLYPCPEGLLVGSASGLYLIPFPARFAFAALPPGDVYCAVLTSSGLLVAMPSGVYCPSGPAPAIPGRVFSLLERSPGHFVAGRLGDVFDDGARLFGPVRDVSAVAASGSDLGVIDAEGVLVLSSGRTQRITLPAANSIVAAGEGFLVGTTTGVWRIATDGRAHQLFGAGLTRVHALPDGVLALDAGGTLYEANGRKIAQMPFTDLVDAAPWVSGACLLARLSDGRYCVGRVDFASGQWGAFDLPLPRSPAALAADGNNLYVVAPGEVMWVNDPPLLPDPPLLFAAALPDHQTLAPPRLRLPADVSEVDLSTPVSRFPPWPVPLYGIKIGAGQWTDYPAGVPMRLERLPWGSSTAVIRASLGGRARSGAITIDRGWPWWLTWPSFGGYAVGLMGFVWVGVRWRTHRLSRRAHQLQEQVDLRTAELRHAQAAREEFFSTLSHEIRNPLNGVVGLCEMIEQAPAAAIAPRERMLTTTLRGCADQLRTLLDDVLDFSRIDRGEIQLNPEVFCLQTAVEGPIAALDPSFEKCHLDLPDREIWLSGDVGKLRQVLTNLISNSLKYGVPPECRILVKVTREAGEHAVVALSVRNTGPTIPADELEHIFEPFARGSEAMRRRIPGSGIGLAVSRRMVEAMGGTLTASSAGGLTEFALKVDLPIGEPPPPPPASAPVGPGGFRVLAIEDETYNRFVLGHLLGRLGYQVDWAVDGASALERVSTGSYDLVLTDYMLPDINGAQLARRILEIAPEPKPPIIAVTAYSTMEKMAEARAAGIRGFVTKPISEKKLSAAILRLGTKVSFHSPQDSSAPSADFSALLRLQDGRQVLMQYARDLTASWEAVAAKLALGDQAVAAKAVHAYRSQVLAVRAVEAAEQLALLEACAQEARWEDARRIAAVVAPMIADLADLARKQAFLDGAVR